MRSETNQTNDAATNNVLRVMRKRLSMPALALVLLSAFTVLSSCTKLCPNGLVSCPDSTSNKLLFDDEFDGASLNLAKWQPNWLGPNNRAITKPINSAELSCYNPSQVHVSGGFLRLSAAARSCKANNGVTYRYTSGLVETRPHFTFTFGHLEARVCLPPGPGAAIPNWPAFWAAGTGTWPVTGELDVMEGLGGRAAGHFHSLAGGPGVHAPGALAMAGCHVYASDWSPGRVTYVYDGQTIGSITSGITSAPMYLILNLGIGGWGGTVHTPSTMIVDYVRVWAN